MTAALDIAGLTLAIGDTEILRGVDLRLEAGRIQGLAGESGSGKTMTGLAVMGLLPRGARTTGRITYGDHELLALPPARRNALRGTEIAMVFQDPSTSLHPMLSVGAQLTDHVRHHLGTGRAAARERAVALLDRVRIPDPAGALRRFPHQFSGGQRQRVALAQVLACGPRALILDEPSTGLDTVTRMRLVRELAALASGGMALLLLSHDHDLVGALADDVVMLDDGRVTGQGAPQDVLPKSAAPARLRKPAPDAPARLELQNLTAWLRAGGRGEVLRDVSLSLPPGGCLAVAGPSGGGKTTLARCIAGLHERHRGNVLLDGTALPPLRRRDRTQKRRVQYVWQEVRGSFDEHRSVLDQV
ncbi:MAG: ABC transporter ATP-binding protein, partial [Pseudonocardia sp.]